MSKKPGKSSKLAPAKASAVKSTRAATKRPAAVKKAAPKAVTKVAAKNSVKNPLKGTVKNTSRRASLDERVALALEAIAAGMAEARPQRTPASDTLKSADAFVWSPEGHLVPVPRVNRVEMTLLQGVDRMRDTLLENTRRFANHLPANNALLWGARGMGKSSLVKAAHATVNEDRAPADKLKLVEIHREDIETLPALMTVIRASDFSFIVFCDDLSFDGQDASYKSLKAVLEGGIEGRPDNVILYATSNRRHLLSRDMIENERSTAINPGEAVEEKVSLSDRFGLWLGFHKCTQDEYLAMVKGYCAHYSIHVPEDELVREALEWSTTRGSRSGRVAFQFVQDVAGRLGIKMMSA